MEGETPGEGTGWEKRECVEIENDAASKREDNQFDDNEYGDLE